jgi:hypothetical protein
MVVPPETSLKGCAANLEQSTLFGRRTTPDPGAAVETDEEFAFEDTFGTEIHGDFTR